MLSHLLNDRNQKLWLQPFLFVHGFQSDALASDLNIPMRYMSTALMCFQLGFERYAVVFVAICVRQTEMCLVRVPFRRHLYGNCQNRASALSPAVERTSYDVCEKLRHISVQTRSQ